MSYRREQLASAIHDGLREILSRGLSDPRVSGMITVTRVDLAGDLSRATAHISVLPADRQDLTMHGLRAAIPHVRRELGKLVQGRSLPQLAFELDESFKKQAAVIEALAKVSAEREAKTKAADAGEASA